MVEIYGDWSTMKSYVGLKAIARSQQDGRVCALIDTEHTFDPDWAERLGVDTKQLIIHMPENGEAAIDAAEALIRAGVDLIVFDSVAATLPQQEQTKRLHKESVQPARLAALMSLALRKLTAANKDTCVLWINQVRMQVGMTFGNPETTPGGRSLPFYASIRLNIRKAGKETEDTTAFDGNKIIKTKTLTRQQFKIDVVKSKLDKPHKQTYFVYDLRTGEVDDLRYMLNIALENGAVQTDGKGYWWVDGEKKVRGVERFVASLGASRLATLAGVENMTPLSSPGDHEPRKKTASVKRRPRSKD